MEKLSPSIHSLADDQPNEEINVGRRLRELPRCAWHFHSLSGETERLECQYSEPDRKPAHISQREHSATTGTDTANTHLSLFRN